jgi:hypothetical protein
MSSDKIGGFQDSQLIGIVGLQIGDVGVSQFCGLRHD